ncbi:MAG: hypothetical protein AAGD07_02020 [Planctomycetota bacterium]
MRIPSSNPEGLYPAPGQRARGRQNHADPWRRLVRMIVVLALVIVVMQQASNPVYYAALFPGQTPQVQVTSGVSHAMEADIRVRPTVSDEVANRVDDYLKEAGEATWPLVWNHLTGSGPMKPKNTTTHSAVLADLDELTQRDPSAARAALLQALLLDRVFASRDGTVWRSDDLVAIKAALQLHREPPRSTAIEDWQTHYADASSTGVVALLQQPDIHRGNRFIAAGELIRLERVAHSDTLYWHLWLKPNDGSNRPWLTVVDTLPSSLDNWFHSTVNESDANLVQGQSPERQQVTGLDVPAPYPIVQVAGVFLKRLSFRSQLGAELTPVIAGRVSSISSLGIASVNVVGQTQGPTTVPSQQSVRLLTLVIGCAVIAISMAAWVMWRSAAEHRELRKRRKHQKIDLS